MDKLFIVKAENRYNQILIFETKKAAQDWASKATSWTPEQIEKNIETLKKDPRGFFSIFPNI